VAAVPPGHSPGGLLRRRRLPGVAFHAGLEAADGDDLIPRPDPDGEREGSTLQDGVWAVVGVVERRDDAVAAQPDEGGTTAARLAARPAAGYRNCAWAKKKQEHPRFFKKNFDN
jgi:hypothetical protein